MATASHVKVKNTTGKAATDIHVTFRGSGGKLQVDASSIKPKDGRKAPRVPSNADDWPRGNEVVIEWDTTEIAADGTVEFDVTSDWGGPEFASGYWTSGDDHKKEIGPINKEDIEITPKAKKDNSLRVVNSVGVISLFNQARIVGNLVIGGMESGSAIVRARTVQAILEATGINPVSTIGIRAALGELANQPREPDAAAIREAVAVSAPPAQWVLGAFGDLSSELAERDSPGQHAWKFKNPGGTLAPVDDLHIEFDVEGVRYKKTGTGDFDNEKVDPNDKKKIDLSMNPPTNITGQAKCNFERETGEFTIKRWWWTVGGERHGPVYKDAPDQDGNGTPEE